MAEETQQPDTNQSDQTPAAAPAGVTFDFSKSVPVSATPQPTASAAPAGVTFDFSKSVPISTPAKKEASTPTTEEPGWFHENVVAPLTDAASRLKRVVLENEGPGWLPYDIAQKFSPKSVPPPATDAEATARLQARNASTAPDQIEIEKQHIDHQRAMAPFEERNAKEYAEGGTRLLSPEKWMTAEEKKDNPVLYGLARIAGSLTSQENLMIMAGSQGLGFVGKAAAQVPKLGALAKLVAATPRLVSAYFAGQMAIGTAQQIPGLVQGKKDYDAAVAAGDQKKADDILWNLKEQTTEAAATAYMSYAAAYHAGTGHPEPIAKAVGGALKETTQYAAEKGVEAIRNVPEVAKATVEGTKAAAGYTVDKLGSLIGRTTDFNTAVTRASKITPKQSIAMKEKIAAVSDDLQAIANANPDIDGPKEFAEKIREHNQTEEAKMQQAAGATKDSTEPVVSGAEQRLRDGLDKLFDDNKGKFPATDVDKAKQDILDHFLQRDEVGKDEKGNPMYSNRMPNLYEAENVRQGLNDLTRPQYAANAQPTTSAFKFGAMKAADLIRGMIDEGYHASGVEGVKEFRSKEAKKIDVANALEAAQDKADKMGEGGVLHSLMKKIGVPSTVIAIALGHPVGAAAIGAAVLGDQISQNLGNPNVNVERALDIAGKNPTAQATEVIQKAQPAPPASAPPINHKLYSALSSHYGKIIGAVPFDDLEQRFMSDIQQASQRGALTPAQQSLLEKVNDVKAEHRSGLDDQQKAEADKTQAEAEKAQVNQQKAADKAKVEAEKATEEAEKKKQEKIDLGMPVSVGAPFEVSDSELDVPEKYAKLGYTPQRIRAHEAGHVVMLHDAGFIPHDVISHLHEDVEDNLASARWNDEEFRDDDGHPDVEKIKNKLPEILAAIYGGSVAEELAYNVPVHSNPGAAGDIKLAKQLMDLVNVPASERGSIMKIAELKAREVLTKPGVIDTIKKHTEFRKAGLDDDLHMDPETIGAMTQEIKNLGGSNGTNDNNPTPGKAGGLGKESKPGGKGGVPSKAKGAARPAGKTGESAGGGEGSIPIGGHAGGEVASVEELARPGRFVKISRSGTPTDQGKTPDFNLGTGEAGYQVKPDGTYELKAGQETPVTKRGVEGYSNALKMNIKGPETPPITEIIPELKNHPEIEQKIKDLGFENVLQKEYIRQHQPPKLEIAPETKVKPGVVEKTTGSMEDDQAIKAGGGVPGGVMDFGEFGKIRMFHDPESGTTLGFKNGEEITPETVKTKLDESRKQYELAEKK